MNSAQREAAQSKMRQRYAERERKAREKEKKEAIKRPRKKRKQRRDTLKFALKQARAVAKKARYTHKRWLRLKNDKRKLTLAVRREKEAMITELRDLYREIRAAKTQLRGARSQFDLPHTAKASLEYARGFREGQEQQRTVQETQKPSQPQTIRL